MSEQDVLTGNVDESMDCSISCSSEMSSEKSSSKGSATPVASVLSDEGEAGGEKIKNTRYVDFLYSDMSLSEDYDVLIEVHKFMCTVVNNLLKNKKIKLIFANVTLKKDFIYFACEMYKLISRNAKCRKEMFRFWKVKRVQIAKVNRDFNGQRCGCVSLSQFNRILSNGFSYVCSVYKTKTRMQNVLYKMLCLLKMMYMIRYRDYFT